MKELDYPVREHVEPIDNVSAAIDFEISAHANAPEFRIGLNTLSKLYGKAPFLYSLQELARFMDLSHVVNGLADKPRGCDNDFYAGTVLGMHSVLRPMSKDDRQAILQHDIFYDVKTDSGTHRFENEHILAITNSLHAWRMEGFFVTYSAMPADERMALKTAAEKVYSDHADPEANIQSFIAGYTYVDQMITALKV